VIAVEHAGRILAERLGLNLPMVERHDLAGPCIACKSSDAFRVHRDTGVAYCHSCGGKWAPFDLAADVLKDRRQAEDLLVEVGLFEPRRNGHHHNGVAVDPIEAIARQKFVPVDALRAFGARATGKSMIELPAYGPDGQQCTTFRMDTSGGKGKFEHGKPAGLFFPHDADGQVRLPRAGERWHLVEGPKDAPALHALGLLACGMNTNRLAPKFARLFSGAEVVMVPDRDRPGEDGAGVSSGVLYGVAAEVAIATLPAEFKETKGPDVRDVLKGPNGRELVLQAIADAKPWKPIAPEACDNRKADSPSIMADEGRTELSNARRFCHGHGDSTRYCGPWSKWLLWDGARWVLDDSHAVEALAKDVSALIWRQIADLAPKVEQQTLKPLVAFAKATGSARGIAAMLSLVRSEPGIPVRPAELDADPWLLNCINGTLNLRTGVLRQHCRDDLITKLCPVEYRPDATAPTWERVVEEWMAGRAALTSFLQRAAGYSLTGDVREHVVLFLYGMGANGKSVFLNTLQTIIGPDYAIKAASELLLSKHSDHHPTELTDLFGRRFVACIETEDGKRMAESLVKELTGGDRIRARRMREDFWEFTPTHKVWLAANHKPVIRGTDHGIWRRIKMVPFGVQIPVDHQDKALPEKLAAEAPGILAWMVRGCLEWQRDGLGEPPEVEAATSAYRCEMDVLGAFIADCCIIAPTAKASAKAVYCTYKLWAERAGEFVMNQTRFGTALTERGYEKYTNNGVWYRGIGLRDED
jgi:putative DNA primase/helicase